MSLPVEYEILNLCSSAPESSPALMAHPAARALLPRYSTTLRRIPRVQVSHRVRAVKAGPSLLALPRKTPDMAADLRINRLLFIAREDEFPPSSKVT